MMSKLSLGGKQSSGKVCNIFKSNFDHSFFFHIQKDPLHPENIWGCTICVLLVFPVKLNSWVEPSFGELLGGVNRSLKTGPLSGESKTTRWPSAGNQAEKKSRKRKVDSHVSSNQISVSSEAYKPDQDEPWVDVYAPQSQVQKLCVPGVLGTVHGKSTFLQFSSNASLTLLVVWLK